LQHIPQPWETATFDEFPDLVKAASRTKQQMLTEAKEELEALRDA